MSEETIKHPPALIAYLTRIGAEILNFRRAMVKVHKGNYYSEKTLIKINNDGKLIVSNKDHAPTKEEAEEIEAQLKECNFPKSIGASEAGCRQYIESLQRDPKKFFLIRSRKTAKIEMIQERVDADDGTKFFRPHTLWSDGKWRTLEPEGNLPFWKPREKRDGVAKIMVHEGAKAAAFVDWLINDRSLEAKAARSDHPWADELADYEHWGILGGALAPHRADYSDLTREQPIEVVYVCDNDWPGRAVLKDFSQHYGGQLRGIVFDSRFKESFDLADPMPEKLFTKMKGERRWKGPTLKSLKISATMATEKTSVPSASGKGRPSVIVKLTQAFREEWMHSVSPELFIHRDWPARLLNANEFNSVVRPFSDVDDTARLLRSDQSNKTFKLHYLPGAPTGFFGDNYNGQYINTYQPSNVKEEAGDAAPWLDYIENLIPDEGDRHEVLRWCATLIARPATKMVYGILLISENQGVGKTTLGEKILSPLVGAHNVSAPSEKDVVESQFNSWIAHKRLAVINEIYAGQSAKAYNSLKSIITDKNITVNKKHQATYEIENWIHIFACSNSTRALKLSFDDRRWLVPKITEEERPLAYWTEFNGWLENEGGLGIVLRWAREWLLDNRAVTPGEKAPATAAKRDMVRDAYSPGQTLIAGILDEAKVRYAGRKVFFTDNSLIEIIKNRLYEGRHNDRLEKPATIRSLAKNHGWFIGSEKTSAFAPKGAQSRILSNDPDVAGMKAEQVRAEGVEEIDLSKEIEM